MNAKGLSGAVVAVPSRGRLREQVMVLLGSAGYGTGMLHGSGSIARLGALSLIEMRPRDAAAALAAGQLDAAFLATDIVMEHDLEELDALELGFSRSDLVLAARDDDRRTSPDQFDGAVVATHHPQLTERFFARHNAKVTIVGMGGSLEGVCAAGLADAIVDLRETGTSLLQNRLRVVSEIRSCQALLVFRTPDAALDDLRLRLEAVLTARAHRYVMLHVPADRVGSLTELFPGLASPTVLPLAGRQDLVAAHFVVPAVDLWERLGDLRALGATGIVALEPQALQP